MVRDAELNREEDQKFHELVDARNKADAVLHATRSAVKEHGDKVPGDVIGRIEAAISDLEGVLKGDDKGQIESRTRTLEEAAQSLVAAASGAGAAGPGAEAPAGGGNDDVVDAEFTEVKDDKKS